MEGIGKNRAVVSHFFLKTPLLFTSLYRQIKKPEICIVNSGAMPVIWIEYE